MFSKTESKKLKKDFWISFGKSFPRKWILYNTKIKDFSFKFHADNKTAGVYLVIEMKDPELRQLYLEKIQSLSTLLEESIGKYEVWENEVLENGKEIHRIGVAQQGVSLYNRDSWGQIFDFFVEKMSAFETFFWEYEDFIKS